MDRCKYCSTPLWKNGHYKKRVQDRDLLFQRVKCSNCGKTDSAFMGSVHGLSENSKRIRFAKKKGGTIIEQSERFCVHCHSTTGIHKNGSWHRRFIWLDGKEESVKMQEYRCSNCIKTYNAFTNTLMSNRSYHPKILKILLEHAFKGEVSRSYSSELFQLHNGVAISRQSIDRILNSKTLNYYLDMWFYKHLPPLWPIVRIDGTWPSVNPGPKTVFYTIVAKTVDEVEVPIACMIGYGAKEHSEELLQLLPIVEAFIGTIELAISDKSLAILKACEEYGIPVHLACAFHLAQKVVRNVKKSAYWLPDPARPMSREERIHWKELYSKEELKEKLCLAISTALEEMREVSNLRFFTDDKRRLSTVFQMLSGIGFSVLDSGFVEETNNVQERFHTVLKKQDKHSYFSKSSQALLNRFRRLRVASITSDRSFDFYSFVGIPA